MIGPTSPVRQHHGNRRCPNLSLSAAHKVEQTDPRDVERNCRPPWVRKSEGSAPLFCQCGLRVCDSRKPTWKSEHRDLAWFLRPARRASFHLRDEPRSWSCCQGQTLSAARA